MRLAPFTDDGLRMLMRLASAPERAFSMGEFAEELGLSRHHLTKIMQRLARGGIVTTRKGSRGGAMLARAPDQIWLGRVVQLLEEDHALVECSEPSDDDCTIAGRCRLKARLRLAEAAFLAELNRTSLADVAVATAPVDDHHVRQEARLRAR